MGLSRRRSSPTAPGECQLAVRSELVRHLHPNLDETLASPAHRPWRFGFRMILS